MFSAVFNLYTYIMKIWVSMKILLVFLLFFGNVVGNCMPAQQNLSCDRHSGKVCASFRTQRDILFFNHRLWKQQRGWVRILRLCQQCCLPPMKLERFRSSTSIESKCANMGIVQGRVRKSTRRHVINYISPFFTQNEVFLPFRLHRKPFFLIT